MGEKELSEEQRRYITRITLESILREEKSIKRALEEIGNILPKYNKLVEKFRMLQSSKIFILSNTKMREYVSDIIPQPDKEIEKSKLEYDDKSPIEIVEIIKGSPKAPHERLETNIYRREDFSLKSIAKDIFIETIKNKGKLYFSEAEKMLKKYKVSGKALYKYPFKEKSFRTTANVVSVELYNETEDYIIIRNNNAKGKPRALAIAGYKLRSNEQIVKMKSCHKSIYGANNPIDDRMKKEVEASPIIETINIENIKFDKELRNKMKKGLLKQITDQLTQVIQSEENIINNELKEKIWDFVITINSKYYYVKQVYDRDIVMDRKTVYARLSEYRKMVINGQIDGIEYNESTRTFKTR